MCAGSRAKLSSNYCETVPDDITDGHVFVVNPHETVIMELQTSNSSRGYVNRGVGCAN